ncbi:MAG TPA: HAD family hydrolase [Rhodocyclaceae bacterium]|nr:HAD family hydrolase [Rhodocyclaceae bacterium]
MHALTMPTTHVLFDFFGTLVSYSDSWVEQGFQQSHQLLLENDAQIDYDAFLEQWAATFDEFERHAQLTLDEYSMDAVCESFLRQTLPRAPGRETITLLRDTYTAEWNKGVSYIPGVKELLAEFAESFALVLVTNTHNADFVRSHLHIMDIAHYFSAVVASVEHGKRKPSACIFERALKLSGGEPETSVYVGDSFEPDYLGANGAGIRCLLIDPTRKHDIPDSDRLGNILDTRAKLIAG